MGVLREEPSAENTSGFVSTPCCSKCVWELLADFPASDCYDYSLVKHFQNADWV